MDFLQKHTFYLFMLVRVLLAYAVEPIVQRREGLRSNAEKLDPAFPGLQKINYAILFINSVTLCQLFDPL